MRFIRITKSHTQGGRVVGVVQQDTPFDRPEAGAWINGEDCEILDLGAAEDQAWSDLQGNPCGPTQHILERMGAGKHHGIATLHDAPCTMDGLRERIRSKGHASLHVKIRAWLSNVLPSHHVKALGLGRNIPISALKSAEALRNKRDPHSGSRMPHLLRVAHKRSHAHAQARLKRRQLEAKAAAKGA